MTRFAFVVSQVSKRGDLGYTDSVVPEALEPFNELGWMNRLGQQREFVPLRFVFLQYVGDACLPGKEKYFRRRMDSGDCDGQIQSIHARHHDVGEEIVRME